MDRFKLLKNIVLGVTLAILTIVVHQIITATQQKDLTAILLVLIGSVYYGFAFLSSNKKAQRVEVVVASLFVIMGLSGLWFSFWIIIIGLFLHGIWDIAHHNSKFTLAQVPKWYIPFCATYDILLAIYLLVNHLNKSFI